MASDYLLGSAARRPAAYRGHGEEAQRGAEAVIVKDAVLPVHSEGDQPEPRRPRKKIKALKPVESDAASCLSILLGGREGTTGVVAAQRNSFSDP